jgi:hypothetical protein
MYLVAAPEPSKGALHACPLIAVKMIVRWWARARWHLPETQVQSLDWTCASHTFLS